MSDPTAAQPGAGRRRWQAVAAVLAVALVVALVLARSDEVDVVIVGDSVTALSRREIFDRVDGAVDLEAVIGARSDEMRSPLRTAMEQRTAADRPLERVALLVGYNDVLQDRVEEEELEAMVADTAEFACAVWLTLPVAEDIDSHLDDAAARAWNERLASLVEPYENVHLETGWQEAVEAADGARLLAADGLHPDAPGAEVLADVYRDALARRC